MRRLLFILAIMASAVALLPGTASAHNWPYYWDPGTRINVYVDGNRFPTGDPNYALRMRDGMNVWNQARVKASEPYYSYGGVTTTDSNFDNFCASPYNGVVWRNIGGYYGYTQWCRPSNGPRIVRIMVAIAYDKPWYRGTGVLGDQYVDLWSVGSHEWGHGLGAPHMTDPPVTSGECPPNGPSGIMMTMCPGPASGDTRQRYPSRHDTDTFHARY